MNDDPKMWIGTPGEDDWRKVGEVTDLDVNLQYDPGVPATQVQDSYVVETKLTSAVGTLLEFMRKYIGEVTPGQEQLYRSVMVVGTRKLAHAHPGPWSLRRESWMPDHVAIFYGAVTRAEHARARRLYSERLRRDRRRKRKGRAPILRTGPNVRALFPRVQVDQVERRGDVFGMRMLTSPHLDAGTVAMFDTQLLDHMHQEQPAFQFQEPLKNMARDCLRNYTSNPFKVNPGDIS